jgi:hypothetical protein
VGIGCCIAGVIGIWRFCPEVSEKVQRISEGLDVALQRASTANQNVRRGVGKARAEVARVGKESANLAGGGEKSRLASRTLRTLLQQQAGPNIDDLVGRLALGSEAAVAVSALLQSFQELAPGQLGRLQPGQVEQWTDQAQQLSATLRRLEGVVGEGDKETSGREVAAATSEVDLLLQKCQATVDDWQSDLDALREKVAQVKAEILGWLQPAAIAATFVVTWVAAGQISLFAHALKWCRGTQQG